MADNRASLGWNNKADAATVAITGEVETLPATNLQVNPVAKVAKKIANTVDIDVDFGSSVQLDFIAVFGLNLTTAGTKALKLSDVAIGNFEILDFATTSAGVIAGYSNAFFDISSLSAQYARITLADASLSEITAGRLAAYGDDDGFYVPTFNESFGRFVGWRERQGFRQEMLGGSLVTAAGTRVRQFEFVLVETSESEVMASLFELGRLAGVSGDVTLRMDPSNFEQKTTVFGVLNSALSIQHLNGEVMRASLVIEERG